MIDKPKLSNRQIFNMNFGFLGIQFGWGLQMANMSAIYEYLGAEPDTIPMLWLAAPLTGLIVQPIIGYFSDRTWHARFGRRRPYFAIGALLSTLALIAMPNASALWIAASLLWVLDASINISMEPFRAFVGDLLPAEQRVRGFAMQSFFIGIGNVMASLMPWFLTNVMGVQNSGTGIPMSVKLAFYFGSMAFFCAVMWTVLSTKEYPPEQMGFESQPDHSSNVVAEVWKALREMPSTMRQLAPVQIFTWLGLFCMWQFFSVAVANNIFGASDPQSTRYREGIEFAGLVLSVYSLVNFLFAPLLPLIAARLGRPATHALCLACGSIGLLSTGLIQNKYLLIAVMVGVGVAWASTISMPYAMLTTSLPAHKMGLYVGIFNFFIVLPEIFQALTFGPLMQYILNNNRVTAVVIGGASMGIAALLSLRVRERVEGEPVGVGARVPVTPKQRAAGAEA